MNCRTFFQNSRTSGKSHHHHSWTATLWVWKHCSGTMFPKRLLIKGVLRWSTKRVPGLEILTCKRKIWGAWLCQVWRNIGKGETWLRHRRTHMVCPASTATSWIWMLRQEEEECTNTKGRSSAVTQVSTSVSSPSELLTEEEMGRQHQGMDRPEVRQVPEGSEEQGKMEKIGCKIICGAPVTLTVKGLMLMMCQWSLCLSGAGCGG